ncbi:MAG: hypothetical protein M3P31_07345, partial [Actinomycetota bacterium]|nr:hypothetical protein [Actinomycetota bacterium]
ADAAADRTHGLRRSLGTTPRGDQHALGVVAESAQSGVEVTQRAPGAPVRGGRRGRRVTAEQTDHEDEDRRRASAQQTRSKSVHGLTSSSSGSNQLPMTRRPYDGHG